MAKKKPEDPKSDAPQPKNHATQETVDTLSFSTETALSKEEIVYHLAWRWAHISILIISPNNINPIDPPKCIEPEVLSDQEKEFVYPIYDYGYRLSTSKGENAVSAGMSMCKLFYTIEKMIAILVERLKAAGVATDTEVQVAFDGFILAKRKAFEAIINLPYNVIITNFDPGEWGDYYLETVKRLAKKGYGYPPESPRDIYRHMHVSKPHTP